MPEEKLYSNNTKPIAIHLPQYHPFAENDAWWGRGFTEWTNVTKSKPKFKGHYQPQLPTDLGFYDLRLEESRLAQIKLAKENGIYGFCYYHYWFNRKRLMHEPIDRMLANKKEDFPFMLCWANENWTRKWDGQEDEILIKQEYNEEDNFEHIEFLCKNFFNDERYIKIEGAPVFVIYRASIIPNVKNFIINANKIAQKHRFPSIYFLCMDNFINEDALIQGFQGAIHFHPDHRYLKKKNENLFGKFLNKFRIKRSFLMNNHYQLYKDYVDNVLQNDYTISKKIFQGITPGWDNSARRKEGALILDKSNPEIFRVWLKQIVNNETKNDNKDKFIFINAWNEWAEGNHLEPCIKWGTEFLKVLKEELR